MLATSIDRVEHSDIMIGVIGRRADRRADPGADGPSETRPTGHLIGILISIQNARLTARHVAAIGPSEAPLTLHATCTAADIEAVV